MTARILPTFSEFSINQRPVAPSLYRKIRDIACKIFFDFWVSTFSYFTKVQEPRHEDPQAVQQLCRQRALTASVLVEYAQEWPRTSSLVQDYLHPDEPVSELNLPEEIRAKTHICIPIVLKGLFRNHIVAIQVNTRAHTVEYYDSKGLTILDRNDDRLNTIIRHVMNQFANYRLTENTDKHQYDSHNCGVYVMNFFRRKIDNNPSQPTSSANMRVTMITELLLHAPSSR